LANLVIRGTGLVLALLTIGVSVINAAPINVGDRKQLFIDQRFIAQSEGIELRVNPPVKRGCILRGEGAWENGYFGGLSTVLDDGTGEYKLYYGAWPVLDPKELTWKNTWDIYSSCLATSRDGVHWEKPNLGLVEYNGKTDNNILPLRQVCHYVFLDPKASPEQRYKLLFFGHREEMALGGLLIAYSPDGIHWTEHPVQLLPYWPDSQNQVFYDTRLDKYVAYFRAWAPGRAVARLEMDDLLQPWHEKLYDPGELTVIPRTKDEFPIVISCDELDPPGTDVYSGKVVQYPWAADVYLAFPSLYYHASVPAQTHIGVQLAVSRDGISFVRSDRRAYIPLGVREGPEGGMVSMTAGMIRRGDEIYQYYQGTHHAHNESDTYDEWRGLGGLYLAVQRLDGFISADAAYTGGWLTTPTVTFHGRRLELNIDCGATGHARVEIRDENGGAVAGLAAGDCDLIRGNHVHCIVTWNGKNDLSTLAGQPIKLYFDLRDAKLYGFQFRN